VFFKKEMHRSKVLTLYIRHESALHGSKYTHYTWGVIFFRLHNHFGPQKNNNSNGKNKNKRDCF